MSKPTAAVLPVEGSKPESGGEKKEENASGHINRAFSVDKFGKLSPPKTLDPTDNATHHVDPDKHHHIDHDDTLHIVAIDTEHHSVDEEKIDPSTVPFWISARFTLALLGFFCYVILYSLKAYMGLAVVCMINHTALASSSSNKSHGGSAGQCPMIGNASGNVLDGPYVWDTNIKGLVLSSFFWGYIITQIPGGYLSERFGSKLIMGWFMFVTVVTSFFIPVAASGSPYAVIALRVLQGIGEGVVWPATSSLWSKWAPPAERSRLVGFTFAGAQIGNVITYPVSGILCEKGFGGGWPSIFYIFGMLGMVWFVLWMLFVSDTPEQHPHISSLERRYIESCLGNVDEQVHYRNSLGTPWLRFLKSRAIWATHVGLTVSNWGTYVILTQLPTYMNDVLHFDIEANGGLSALPFLAYWIMINLASVLADKLRTRGIPTKLIRKVFFGVGTILPAIFLIITGYVPCDTPYGAVATVVIAVGLCGFQYPGVFVNHADIAAPFAGILFGISNTFGTIPGIVAPYAVQIITASKTVDSWRTVFYITAAIYVAGAIFFAIFSEGETRPWVKHYILPDAHVQHESHTKIDASEHEHGGHAESHVLPQHDAEHHDDHHENDHHIIDHHDGAAIFQNGKLDLRI